MPAEFAADLHTITLFPIGQGAGGADLNAFCASQAAGRIDAWSFCLLVDQKGVLFAGCQARFAQAAGFIRYSGQTGADYADIQTISKTGKGYAGN